MKCPFCENIKTRVADSRELNEGFTVRRRRVCEECGTRFTTYESLKIHKMQVLKRNNKYEPFNREKIVNSIKRACIKLPISADEIEEIIREVESRIWRNPSREIPSIEIGKIILNHLKIVHPLAFLRFAGVFNEHKSIDDLTQETIGLKREIEESLAKQELLKQKAIKAQENQHEIEAETQNPEIEARVHTTIPPITKDSEQKVTTEKPSKPKQPKTK